MSKRNFSKTKAKANIQRRGYEPRAGANLLPAKIRKRKTKFQQRAEAADISPETMMTKIVSCRHGHCQKMRIAVLESTGPFQCTDCGEVAR